jgi:hypothetical protein
MRLISNRFTFGDASVIVLPVWNIRVEYNKNARKNGILSCKIIQSDVGQTEMFPTTENIDLIQPLCVLALEQVFSQGFFFTHCGVCAHKGLRTTKQGAEPTHDAPFHLHPALT